jgi:plasmid stabilization system protein ParE
MHVRWLDSAYAEAQAIFDYIAADDRRAADRWADAIADKAAALADAPSLGAPLERYRNARYLTHGNYVLYYTVHRQEVVIRAVKHGAMRFRSAWLRREE